MSNKKARPLARLQQAGELRKLERRRVRRRMWVVVGSASVTVAVVGIVAMVVLGSPSGVATSNSSRGVWAAPTDVESGVRAAGLHMLSAEGDALHIHQHVSITVDGAAVVVPADLGIDVARRQISPIHTHDETGIIHLESPTVAEFTLGQVFDEWQQRLGVGQVGVYQDGRDGQTVTFFVNGKRVAGDPRLIELTSHEEIDIVVAAKGSSVKPPPAFQWPAGY